MNGLAERREFADWHKSFVDEVATHYDDFPVIVMLVGVPDKRNRLADLQPSLMRVFRVVEIEKLTDDEVRTFLDRAFRQANRKVDRKALDLLVRYSSGLPILMHEIGDATFWEDRDGVIDSKDAAFGVTLAAERIGKKYLDPKVYGAIRSTQYRSILRKLANVSITRDFAKSHMEARLNVDEKKVLHNFLQKLGKLGIIEQDKEQGPGFHKFANEVYPVYIWMESERYRGTSRKL